MKKAVIYIKTSNGQLTKLKTDKHPCLCSVFKRKEDKIYNLISLRRSNGIFSLVKCILSTSLFMQIQKECKTKDNIVLCVNESVNEIVELFEKPLYRGDIACIKV